MYGKQQLTYNLHNLVFHMCDDVERHGSSSLHAMWSLESSLGELTRSVKGNRGVSNQILSSKLLKYLVCLFLKFIYLIKKMFVRKRLSIVRQKYF